MNWFFHCLTHSFSSLCLDSRSFFSFISRDSRLAISSILSSGLTFTTAWVLLLMVAPPWASDSFTLNCFTSYSCSSLSKLMEMGFLISYWSKCSTPSAAWNSLPSNAVSATVSYLTLTIPVDPLFLRTSSSTTSAVSVTVYVDCLNAKMPGMSSSMMVTSTRSCRTFALSGDGAFRHTKKDSSASGRSSSTIGTSISAISWPAPNLRMPSTAR
mmetsp:Transcript_9114/g.32798  ORF Transcript_9114/g.32798 Transcript_9114/m.32798 type:complete len:213 (+) Transcript_9114:713-1351(+)